MAIEKSLRVMWPFGPLSAEVKLPSSKSISNRLLVMNRLSEGAVQIEYLSDCQDTRVLQGAFGAGGETVDVGNCGTAFRFLTAFYSLWPGERILTGNPAMRQRPIGPLVEALRKMGVAIRYEEKEGFPPIWIRGGGLAGGHVQINPSISSQFVSALMLVGPYLEKGLTIHFDGSPASFPYIEMTARIMERAGAMVEVYPDAIRVHPIPFGPCVVEVEPDWSSATIWYALAALRPGSAFRFPRLQWPSVQGDSELVNLFRQFGVKTSVTPGGIQILSGDWDRCFFEYNFKNQPDLFPVMAVFLAVAGVPFSLTGLGNLRFKESDRLQAILQALVISGYTVRNPLPDVLEWDGRRDSPIAPTLIFDSRDDHRLAMAFSLLSSAGEVVEILNPETVQKSYPTFWLDMKKAGFELQPFHRG